MMHSIWEHWRLLSSRKQKNNWSERNTIVKQLAQTAACACFSRAKRSAALRPIQYVLTKINDDETCDGEAYAQDFDKKWAMTGPLITAILM